jgi:hypothetical protein
VMALMLLLLTPQNGSPISCLLLRLAGLVFLLSFVLVAVAASLLGSNGDDCLGYTVFAIRGGQVEDVQTPFETCRPVCSSAGCIATG